MNSGTPKLALQPPDLLGQRRLGREQPFRRASEIPFHGDGGELVLAAYLTCTCLAALACAYAVYLNVTHARLIIDTARRLDIPVSLMVPFGILLGSAAVGLLAGPVVHGLGTAAAAGLVAYFGIALAAHVRAHDLQIAWALIYLSLAGAALATGLAYHGPLG